MLLEFVIQVALMTQTAHKALFVMGTTSVSGKEAHCLGKSDLALRPVMVQQHCGRRGCDPSPG